MRYFLFIFAFLLVGTSSSLAQKKAQKTDQKNVRQSITIDSSGKTNNQNVFVSPVDQDLTLKTLLLLPVTDNVDEIYSKPVEEELRAAINADLQWSLAANTPAGEAMLAKTKANTLDENPKQVSQMLKTSGADGLLVAHMTKGPAGINGTLTLFLGREGLPLLQETLVNYKGFDIVDVRNEFRKLFVQLKSRLPYRGLILSRRGQQVTLNLGSSYGLKPETNVTVVQIIKVNRHPKLHFMVSTEKEVLGRVQLAKVDEHLSFGSIIFEREPGVVAVGGKILPEEFVKYPTPVTTPDGKILQNLAERKDKDVAFGDSPKEWVPEAPPQYGKFAILAGISTYEQNSTLIGGPSISGNNYLAPSIAARGELWLNPNWFVGFNLRQSVFSVSNTYSSPNKLNMSFGQYGVNAGYNLLLSNDFFGPKLQISGGFADSKFKVDDSTPTAFSSMDYSGFLIGLAGQFPLSDEIPMDVGANFNYWVTAGLSENTSSGSSSNTVNSFGFYLDYRLRPKFNVKAEVDFDYYNSNFSGTPTRPNPASGTSHKFNTFLVGIEYLL
jgi:hypothetical protein